MQLSLRCLRDERDSINEWFQNRSHYEGLWCHSGYIRAIKTMQYFDANHNIAYRFLQKNTNIVFFCCSNSLRTEQLLVGAEGSQLSACVVIKDFIGRQHAE